jgi:hypothetical protein
VTLKPELTAAFGGNNSTLIAAIAEAGLYLHKESSTIDCTYGLGNFWKLWQPNYLLGCDIDPAKSPVGFSVDFTQLSQVFGRNIFDVAVFDPPYMLNGTSRNQGPASKNASYGVNTPYTPMAVKHELMRVGLIECIKVVKGGTGYVLFKCMNQVSSGQVRWQTYMARDWADVNGAALVDEFHLLQARHSAQPPGRQQLHARRNYSTLMVFQKRR